MQLLWAIRGNRCCQLVNSLSASWHSITGHTCCKNDSKEYQGKYDPKYDGNCCTDANATPSYQTSVSMNINVLRCSPSRVNSLLLSLLLLQNHCFEVAKKD